MVEHIKLLKTYNNVSITTSEQTAESFYIDRLGNLKELALAFTITTVAGTGGAYASNGQNIGSNFIRLIRSIKIIDTNGENVLDLRSAEIHFYSKYMQNKYGDKLSTLHENTLFSSDATNFQGCYKIPLRVNINDLPASVEITFNKLSEFFSTVGTGASITFKLEIYGVYTSDSIETDRCLVVRTATAVNTTTDFREKLPVVKSGLWKAILVREAQMDSITAPAELGVSNLGKITFRRSAKTEIESVPYSVFLRNEMDRYLESSVDYAILIAENVVINAGVVVMFEPANNIKPTFWLIY